jgi:fructose-1,6-bisphosphatase I
MKIPEKGKIYSVNEANQSSWEEPVFNYFASLKQGTAGASARYIGSMVADVHRTLLYGGIFAYPADRATGKGKLRLFYECCPMSMLIEQAGGKAIDSRGQRILDIIPGGIHDRSAIILGSPVNVSQFESFLL